MSDPRTRLVGAGYDELTGVDLSERQLERARERVPRATFLHGDLTSIELPTESFDAVVAFYVFNHVPRDLLARSSRASVHGSGMAAG